MVGHICSTVGSRHTIAKLVAVKRRSGAAPERLQSRHIEGPRWIGSRRQRLRETRPLAGVGLVAHRRRAEFDVFGDPAVSLTLAVAID